MTGELNMPVPILGQQGNKVQLKNPDGTISEIAADVATFMAVDQLLAMQTQIIVRLDSLHAHMARNAHPKSAEFRRCPTCMTIQAQQQVESKDANVVAGNVGASAVVPADQSPKAQIEQAMEAEMNRLEEEENGNQ